MSYLFDYGNDNEAPGPDGPDMDGEGNDAGDGNEPKPALDGQDDTVMEDVSDNIAAEMDAKYVQCTREGLRLRRARISHICTA